MINVILGSFQDNYVRFRITVSVGLIRESRDLELRVRPQMNSHSKVTPFYLSELIFLQCLSSWPFILWLPRSTVDPSPTELKGLPCWHSFCADPSGC